MVCFHPFCNKTPVTVIEEVSHVITPKCINPVSEDIEIRYKGCGKSKVVRQNRFSRMPIDNPGFLQNQNYFIHIWVAIATCAFGIGTLPELNFLVKNINSYLSMFCTMIPSHLSNNLGEHIFFVMKEKTFSNAFHISNTQYFRRVTLTIFN